jgi:hypothetical protein
MPAAVAAFKFNGSRESTVCRLIAAKLVFERGHSYERTLVAVSWVRACLGGFVANR